MKKINKTKQKILDCAEKLFSEKGYDKTSIDDITKLAQTTKSLFYYYFKSKNEILYTLMKIRIEEAAKKVIEKRKETDITVTKEALYKTCFELVKENQNIFKIGLLELLKTNCENNIILDLPKEIFLEFKSDFNYTEKEQLVLVLNVIKATAFFALQESLIQRYDISESELLSLYNY